LGAYLFLFCLFYLFFEKNRLRALYLLSLLFSPFCAVAVFNIKSSTHFVQVTLFFVMLLFWLTLYIKKTYPWKTPLQFSHFSKIAKFSLVTGFLFLFACLISIAFVYFTHNNPQWILDPETHSFYKPIGGIIYLLIGYLFTFMIYQENKTLNDLETTYKIILFSGLIVVFFESWQVLAHYMHFSYPYYFINNSLSPYTHHEEILTPFGLLRPYSIFNEPSHLGHFLIIPCSILFVGVIAKKTNMLPYVNNFFALFIFTYFSLLSFSSALYVAIFFLFSFMGILLFLFYKNILLCYIKALLCFIIVLIFTPHVYQFLYFDILHKTSSTSGLLRVHSIVIGWFLFLKHPFFGYGFMHANIHDTLINLLGNLGLFGTTIFYIFLIYIFISLYIQLKYIEKTNNQQLKSMLCTSAYVLLSTFFYMEINGITYSLPMMWLAIGLSIASINITASFLKRT
jgi:hypothetical protein